MQAKKVSDELSTAGQVTPEDLQQVAQAGYQSILNLRTAGEAGALADEQAQAEAAGLHYAQVPLSSATATAEDVEQALVQLEVLPKPVLLHCGAGLRATAIALIAEAIQAGLTPEEIAAKAADLQLPLNQPHLQQFLSEYIVQEATSE